MPAMTHMGAAGFEPKFAALTTELWLLVNLVVNGIRKSRKGGGNR